MKPLVVRALMPFTTLACCLLFGCQGLWGAEFRTDDRAVVKADEVIDDDLYIFGDEVTIDGKVTGDVIAFGRLIRMNGSVEGDFIAAGQAIVVNGEVGDDMRAAGQVLKIDENATIADDLIVAGFSLEITDASSIDGDLVYAGYQAMLAGDVGGKVHGAMANCEVSGNIGGNMNLNVGGDQAGAQAYTAGSPPPISFPNVPPGLSIRETARIEGELKYESPGEADIAAGAQIDGEITHKRPHVQTTRAPTRTERTLSLLGQFVTMLILGSCAVLIAPKWTRHLSDNIKTRPFASLGLGVAGIVGFIVLLLVILVAMIVLAVIAGSVKLTGLVPAVIVLGLSGGALLIVSFWFFTTYLAGIVLSLFAGRWLLGLTKPTLGENRFLSLLLGLVLLTLISSVPYLGSIVGWLVVLFGLGALVGWMLWRRTQGPMPPEKPQLGDA